jgi:hypothetical protein
MYKQILTCIRPNTDTPFFHEATEYAEIQQLRTTLREAHPELVISSATTLSSDGLTFTNTLRYHDKAAYDTYVKLVKSTVPNWPTVRNQYYARNQHVLIAETQENDKLAKVVYTI